MKNRKKFEFNLVLFLQFIAPYIPYEEYRLTLFLFTYADYFKLDTFSIYLVELLNGFINSDDSNQNQEIIPIDLNEEQILTTIVKVNKRKIFQVEYLSSEKRLEVTFHGHERF